MFCTAGMLVFIGLDFEPIAPKQMILITGAICGFVNVILGWLNDD